MWDQHLYVREKLEELEREHRSRQLLLAATDADVPRRRAFAPFACGAGRALRRAGEALEAWASPRAVRSR